MHIAIVRYITLHRLYYGSNLRILDFPFFFVPCVSLLFIFQSVIPFEVYTRDIKLNAIQITLLHIYYHILLYKQTFCCTIGKFETDFPFSFHVTVKSMVIFQKQNV